MSNRLMGSGDETTKLSAAGMVGGSGNAVAALSTALPGALPGEGLAPVPAYSGTLRLPGVLFLMAKRGFDIVFSLVGLAVFGVMLPILALIIKLDSPGSVFFSQERVGINRRRSRQAHEGQDRRKVLQPGRPFKVIKLRTMGVHAEVNGPQWATKNDVRVTRVGRFLRKTRLDELPQLLNVLRGEMSLVGPRPERLVFVRQLEKEIPFYRDRLLVLPGLTGLAQVINGYDDGLESVRRKIELDRQYIHSSGFVTEFKILLATVSVVLKGEGAR
jgi:lipopolysaccharide/colanic/teichoic acid biosynthesis glycosyltransferase